MQLEREGARVGGIAEPGPLVRDAWARAAKAGSCFSCSFERRCSHRPSGFQAFLSARGVGICLPNQQLGLRWQVGLTGTYAQ